jgi:hypothetical protein
MPLTEVKLLSLPKGTSKEHPSPIEGVGGMRVSSSRIARKG